MEEKTERRGADLRPGYVPGDLLTVGDVGGKHQWGILRGCGLDFSPVQILPQVLRGFPPSHIHLGMVVLLEDELDVRNRSSVLLRQAEEAEHPEEVTLGGQGVLGEKVVDS